MMQKYFVVHILSLRLPRRNIVGPYEHRSTEKHRGTKLFTSFVALNQLCVGNLIRSSSVCLCDNNLFLPICDKELDYNVFQRNCWLAKLDRSARNFIVFFGEDVEHLQVHLLTSLIQLIDSSGSIYCRMLEGKASVCAVCSWSCRLHSLTTGSAFISFHQLSAFHSCLTLARCEKE